MAKSKIVQRVISAPKRGIIQEGAREARLLGRKAIREGKGVLHEFGLSEKKSGAPGTRKKTRLTRKGKSAVAGIGTAGLTYGAYKSLSGGSKSSQNR